MKDATTSTPKTLCIHSRANGEEAATRRYLQEAIAENMLPHLPPHSRLRVCRWKTKTTGRFHERQLLTDIGGVQFTDAIQEGEGFERLAWMPRDKAQPLFQKAREKFELDAKSSDELILVDSFTWTFDADEAEWKLDYRENPEPTDDS